MEKRVDGLTVSQAKSRTTTVVVIGAGIIGISCAVHLLRRGVGVLVVDRDGIAQACSWGNAGILESSSVIPVAAPGLLRRLPRLLLDPAAPLVIRPRYLPRLLPWLWRFWLQSTRSRCEKNARALAVLLARSVAAYQPLLEWADATDLVRHSGWLVAYQSKKLFLESAWERDYRRRLGVRLEHWGDERLRREIPALSPTISNAVFYPQSACCIDPHGLVCRLADAFQLAGGAVAQADIIALKPRRKGITAVAREREFHADKIIVAAGAWSDRLAKLLGDRVPLGTERGYHSMLPESGVTLPLPVMFDDAKFVATPMRHGLRLAGTAELASVDAAPDYSRADQLMEKAKEFLPGLDCSGASRWMGCRPTLPDSLPVIGFSPRQPRVLYAFGHQHLGLTMGAITGRVVSQLCVGDPVEIDLNPYRADRF